MTLEQLAALPVGTKVRFFLEPLPAVHDEVSAIYDFGEITQAGPLVHIRWDVHDDSPENSIIDTKSQVWLTFVKEIEVNE